MKMKLIKILLLSTASLTILHAFKTSFHVVSLVKNANAISGSIKDPNRSLLNTEKLLSRSVLKASEDALVSEEKKQGLLERIWNDNTKIVAYLAVWYLGNIYCKDINCVNSHFMTLFLFIR